jgi:fibronectin-binding autotransporter adhesin
MVLKVAGRGDLTTIGAGASVVIEDGGSIDALNTALTTVAGSLTVNNMTFTTGPTGLALAGGTLGGSGSITGNVASTGGTLVPGASRGTLTVDGDLSLDEASILDFEMGAPLDANDLIEVTGGLVLDGILNVADDGGFGPGTYTILTYDPASSFSNSGLLFGVMPTGFFYNVDLSTEGEVRLGVVPVPEPVSAAVLALAGLAALHRRRR